MGKSIEKINPLEKALGMVGKKYDLLILETIFKRNKRAGFNQMLKEVPGINPRILSLRLKDLESNKLLTKNLILSAPVKTEYALTQKSEELIEIIEKLKNWVGKY
ncbi:MAG: helix-turn-helix domain-containing protein [archaeon]|jgi:DNA-binding HxlR family transcriptional regulator